MNAEAIIQEFDQTQTFNRETILAIENHEYIGRELVQYFLENKNREWALGFIKKAVEIRSEPYPKGYDVGAETMMLSGYILGLHQNIEDCLEIWNAKTVDFDTFCAFDIQLVVFAGLEPTIAYLKQQHSEMAEKALQYIQDCKKAGDFDDLDEYYDLNTMPYFIG